MITTSINLVRHQLNEESLLRSENKQGSLVIGQGSKFAQSEFIPVNNISRLRRNYGNVVQIKTPCVTLKTLQHIFKYELLVIKQGISTTRHVHQNSQYGDSTVELGNGAAAGGHGPAPRTETH